MAQTQNRKIWLAVVGAGGIGVLHARDIIQLTQAELVAVCNRNRTRTDQIAAQLNVDAYYDYQTLLDQAKLDGIVIATPHYDHVPVSIAALQKGIHVLVEKPIAVHVKDTRKMIDAYEAAKATWPNLVFAAMFMQRTYGYWRKIKDLIDSGELGQLVRITWIITDWFRNQSYYDGGGWRATWAGEGGGVLMNQCMHNLDMYQWLVGMPSRVRGFAALGKYHDIEVEDEVTAYFEHKNGMIGHLITTTGESPGTNRLEIVGERGKLVYENGRLTFFRNRHSMLTHLRECPRGFEKVENWQIDIPFEHHGQPGHAIITADFVEAILHERPPLVAAAEGYHSVVLNNAIMLSSFENRVVTLPLDEKAFEEKLQQLIANSRYEKPATSNTGSIDMSDSFGS